MIQYLLHEDNADREVVTKLGFAHIMMHLASSEDAQVREGALRGLLDLAQNKKGATNGSLGEEDEKLKQILQDRIKFISLMSPEDLGAVREEGQLVDSLWNACYNEPSSLRDNGVIQGEDELPPDVASKYLEPALRAWASNTAADEKSPI